MFSTLRLIANPEKWRQDEAKKVLTRLIPKLAQYKLPYVSKYRGNEYGVRLTFQGRDDDIYTALKAVEFRRLIFQVWERINPSISIAKIGDDRWLIDEGIDSNHFPLYSKPFYMLERIERETIPKLIQCAAILDKLMIAELRRIVEQRENERQAQQRENTERLKEQQRQQSAEDEHRKQQHEKTSQREKRSDAHSKNENQKPPASASCYEILGVSADCTWEQVRIAYREVAKLYHPDKVAHLAPEFVLLAESRMKAINAAYEEVKQIHNL